MLVEEFNNCIYVGINNNLEDKKNQWIIFKAKNNNKNLLQLKFIALCNQCYS